jgi:hypothetical protein
MASSGASRTPGRGPIEVVDLSALGDVRGGIDEQTTHLQLAITQAVAQMKELARSLVPTGPNLFELLSQFQPHGRSRSGPSSAPALPPPSTLTR